MRKLTHEEIVGRQVGKLDQPKLPFCAVLNNIRSLHNVGSIFRTADGVGLEKLWLCGITGYPPQGGLAKTALGAEDHVVWEYRKEIIPLLQELKAQGYLLVLLEQMHNSIPHDDFRADKPVCLIVGNEVEGISEQIIALCDTALEIDMAGIKNSLNVATAFGVVAYHIRSSFKKSSSACLKKI